MDMEGVVQAVNVTGKGGLGVGGVWDVLDLVRDAFTGMLKPKLLTLVNSICVYISVRL